MKMNRRNVLIGIGAIVGGGGAALGTGAFSSAEADRGLEVEVIVDDDIAADAADVHIDTDHGTVSIDGEEATDLFPEEETTYEDAGGYTAPDTNVSLIQNDVTVLFGPYLGEAETSYDDLFTVINSSETDSGDFDVTFDVDEEGPFEINESNDTTVTVDEGDTESLDLSVTAEDDETDTLTIRIEASD